MPPKKDKFDLTKLVNKSNDIEVISQPIQDYQSYLIGYEQVDPVNWDKLLTRSHIRYLRTDGKFVRGGYVKAISRVLDSENKPTFKIEITSDFTPKAIFWSIYKGNIATLWKKIEMTPMVDTNAITEVKEDIDFLKKKVEMLEIDFQNTKNELLRAVALIKKLYKQ
jgi:hypothetical protein